MGLFDRHTEGVEWEVHAWLDWNDREHWGSKNPLTGSRSAEQPPENDPGAVQGVFVKTVDPETGEEDGWWIRVRHPVPDWDEWYDFIHIIADEHYGLELAA